MSRPGRIRHTVLSLVLAVALTTACGREPSTGVEWPRSTPTEHGLDTAAIAELVELIRAGDEFPDLHSLLIVRNGVLIVEEYFGGFGPDRLHTLQSVSKSVTSALIGIAIEGRYIEGVDERVVDFFPQWRDELVQNPRRAAQRLEDILTMRTGTDYHEGYPGSPHDQLNHLESGWDWFWLNRPMVRDPGTYWQYDSGGVIALSSMLRQRTGMHADRFAEEFLFPDIGISQWSWYRNQEGHPHTGGGLNLRPLDMARFGLLYLQNGRWGDRQVVPARWVEESCRRHVDFEPVNSPVTGYGYLWWILSPDPAGPGQENICAAMGFRAQYIFVVPEHDMVVVVTGGTQNSRDQVRPIDFLYSHILPAVER